MERSEPNRARGPAAADNASTFVLGGPEDLVRVLQHLQSGVVAHAPDTSIRVCNPRACEILGLSMDQMIGVAAPDPKWMFIRPDGSPMPLEEYPVNVVLRTREPFRNLLVGVNRPTTDDRVWVRCNGHPVFTPDGELDLIIISFIDVTEVRHAEDQREELEAQLRQATKMEAIGRLAGGIAHDFNNILTGILGFAEIGQDSLSPEHKAAECLLQIRQGGEHAADLTRQLLAFARKQVIEPRVIRPNDVVGRAEKMLGRLIGEDVELRFEPDPALWNVKIDPSQLDQVLVNLAVNARDAMPSGGRLLVETANVVLDQEPHVMGPEAVSGEFVQVAVTDTGHGMDRETQERIFEPFFSTKGPGEGTGLGLATVYGVVRQNGGVITVYSEPGRGTAFKIYLPAVREAAQSLTTLPVAPGGRGHETVLLVEDNAGVRALVLQILKNNGYSVLSAADPAEALSLSEEFEGEIDIVLTDVVMPGMDGRQLVDALRAQRPSLLALFMSGYTESVVAHQGMLEEGTSFLPKPFSRDGLLGRMRDVLG